MARGEAEITAALTYLEVSQTCAMFRVRLTLCFQASKAQLQFIRNYPQMAEQLTQIARGMV